MKQYHFLIVILILLFATATYAATYKYVDEEGNTRYTDDIALVPEDQRGPYLEELQRQEALEEETEQEAEDAGTEETEETTEADTEEATETEEPDQPGETDQSEKEEEDNWPDYDEEKSKEEPLDEMLTRLNTTRKELQTEYDAIQEEKKKLAASKKDAVTPETIKAYNDKARDINARAKVFKEKYDTLQKEQEIYNTRAQEANEINAQKRAAEEERKAEEAAEKKAQEEAQEESEEKTE
jgi:hypothetical protein